MSLVELLYLHLVAIGVSTLAYFAARSALHGVVDQMNARLTQIKDRDDAQRKVNVWLADKIAAVDAKVPAKRPGSVTALRSDKPDSLN